MAYRNTIETLLARQDIHDVIMRYARGIDRGDEALLLICYWDDAHEVHGPAYNGPAVPYVKGAVQRMQAAKPVMQHFIGNVHIDFAGDDEAWVESYILTFARFAKDGTDYDTLTGARAHDRFERRPTPAGSEWRIAHRRAVFDWNSDRPSSETWCLGLFDTAHPDMVMGAKAPDDLTYRRA